MVENAYIYFDKRVITEFEYAAHNKSALLWLCISFTMKIVFKCQ